MMSRSGVFVLSLVFVAGMGCAPTGPPKTDVETAFDQMWVVLDEIEAPGERVPILEQFIADYPDTERAENALGDVIYYRTEEMDDLPGALAVAGATLAQTSDPELRFKIGLRLHDLSARNGEPTDLAAVADELATYRQLGFVDHLNVVEAGEKSGAWSVMLDHAMAMEAFANETAFRAAYPDDDFSDERVTSSVNRRKAWVLAYKGGALTKLGRLEEAEGVFLEAEEIPAITDYLGIPETPIDLYRGEAALLSDRPEEAAEFFAHDAVMGGNPTALDGLKEAYFAMDGDEGGFDAFIGKTRERIARTLGDVAVADYSGDLVDLSSLAGKVAVISFWNPG
jgi:hypothetical protein